MQCGQNVQLLNVKLLVHHVTSRLLKRLSHGHLSQPISPLKCGIFLMNLNCFYETKLNCEALCVQVMKVYKGVNVWLHSRWKNS